MLRRRRRKIRGARRRPRQVRIGRRAVRQRGARRVQPRVQHLYRHSFGREGHRVLDRHRRSFGRHRDGGAPQHRHRRIHQVRDLRRYSARRHAGRHRRRDGRRTLRAHFGRIRPAGIPGRVRSRHRYGTARDRWANALTRASFSARIRSTGSIRPPGCPSLPNC